MVVASETRTRQVLSSKLGWETDNLKGFGDLPHPTHCTDYPRHRPEWRIVLWKKREFKVSYFINSNTKVNLISV
jgi:hypothetical protein